MQSLGELSLVSQGRSKGAASEADDKWFITWKLWCQSESFPEECFSFLRVSLGPPDVAKIHQYIGQLGRSDPSLAILTLQLRKNFSQKRLRLLHILVFDDLSQGSGGEQSLGVVLCADAPLNFDIFFEMLCPQVLSALAEVTLGKRPFKVGPDFRLCGKFSAFELSGGFVEDICYRGVTLRFPRGIYERIGIFERLLEECAYALGPSLLSSRRPRLPRSRDYPAKHGQQYQSDGSYSDAVALHKFRAAIRHRIFACDDWKAVEMPANVLRKFCDRLITPRWFFAHRLENNVVQIASQGFRMVRDIRGGLCNRSARTFRILLGNRSC